MMSKARLANANSKQQKGKGKGGLTREPSFPVSTSSKSGSQVVERFQDKLCEVS